MPNFCILYSNICKPDIVRDPCKVYDWDLSLFFILDGSCENDPYQESGGMADYPPSPESWIGDGMENAPPGQGNPIGHIPPSSGPGGPQPPYE